ncbi:MAG: DOMON-like domain-containing protein [Cyanobacteria bacterium P01_D01_bin.105]
MSNPPSSGTTNFSLVPFANSELSHNLAVSGTAAREGSTLSISYLLAGDIDKVVLPELNSCNDRAEKLWEETCFELFLGVGLERAKDLLYREFNFSPSGAWNVLTLQGYRYATKEEPSFEALPFKVVRADEGLTIETVIDISSLADEARPIRLGISAVILVKDMAGEAQETFWAIAHPTSKPDFHHPNSFALSL